MLTIARVATLALGIAACGGPGRPAAPAVPDTAALRAYPALRWVPANVDVVLAARGVGEAVDALGGAAAAIAEVGGQRPDAVGRIIAGAIGIDLLSTSALAAAGVDLSGPAVIYAQGVGATGVLRVPDPEAMRTWLADFGAGQALRSATVDGVEVSGFTEDFLHTRWAFADGWMWVHVDLSGRDRADAWFTESRAAAGAFGAEPDAAWALDAASSRLDGEAPAGLVVARPGALVKGPGQLVLAMIGWHGCAAMIEQVPVLAVGLDPTAGGAIVARLPSTDALLAMVTPEPSDWSAAGPAPAVLGAVNVDVPKLALALAPCGGDLLTDVLAPTGVRRGRGFVESFDINGFRGDFGFAVDLEHARMIRGLLDQIPMRSLLESSATFGNIRGTKLSVPLVGTFHYALEESRFLVGRGKGGDLAQLAGGAGARGGSLAHLTLRPAGITTPTWAMALSQLGLDDAHRRGVIEQLQRWAQFEVRADLAGDEVTLLVRAQPTPP